MISSKLKVYERFLIFLLNATTSMCAHILIITVSFERVYESYIEVFFLSESCIKALPLKKETKRRKKSSEGSRMRGMKQLEIYFEINFRLLRRRRRLGFVLSCTSAAFTATPSLKEL